MIEPKYKYNRVIRNWLIVGLVMLVGQVILGGITRLTGSGLSITRWDIVSGTIPPLGIEEWQAAFDLYKQTPQYHKINATFTLNDFKFIYFWEYFHRLWARILGIVFLIPFVIFLYQKKINSYLIKRLAWVVLLTAITASAGWIMVQSGLIDRPWVNAYKLSIHFVLALLVIAVMVKTIADVYNVRSNKEKLSQKLVFLLVVVTGIQMVLAGMMSGMKAGLYYPSWPDMNGSFIPNVLLNSENYTWANMKRYDEFVFAPALIQFLHRMVAYLLVVLSITVFYKYYKIVSQQAKKWLVLVLVLVVVQFTLGVLTVLNVNMGIPLFYGVSHQLVGLLYFIALLFFTLSLRNKRV